MAESDNPERPKVPRDSNPVPPKVVHFEMLTEGRNEIIIEHHGQEYRLRATRNGGLILNK